MSITQDISSLNINNSDYLNLIKQGFRTVQDISTNNSNVVLNNLNNLIRVPETKTALTLLKEENSIETISTFIDDLDKILNGVLRNGQITEFVGLPASGRTQLCLHLSISSQIIQDNLIGKVIYLTTKHNFSISRLKEIAENYIKHVPVFKNINLDDILKNIYCVDINTLDEFKTCINDLKIFIRGKNVKLLIIDSITYPLRQADKSTKVNLIYSLIQKIRSLSKIHEFTVVVTNDMTTIPGSVENVPSLRETFLHIINNRILLSRDGTSTLLHAKLIKSSSKLPDSCDFYLL